MTTSRLFGLVAAAALVLSVVGARAGEPNWPDQLIVGTASQGGTYYVYGEGLARILSRALNRLTDHAAQFEQFGNLFTGFMTPMLRLRKFL